MAFDICCAYKKKKQFEQELFCDSTSNDYDAFKFCFMAPNELESVNLI